MAIGKINSRAFGIITIGEKLDSGGEGQVLLTGYPDLLLKVYDPDLDPVTNTAQIQEGKQRKIIAYTTFSNLMFMKVPELECLPSEYIELPGGIPAYLMSRAKGKNLQDVLLGDLFKLSIQERLRISKGLAKALDYLHSSQVIHADIRPDNFFLHKEANDYTVFVLDIDGGGYFGPVERVGPNFPPTVSPRRLYQSPELVFQSSLEIWKNPNWRRQPDLWALAVLLYQILVDKAGPFPTRPSRKDIPGYLPYGRHEFAENGGWPKNWQYILMKDYEVPYDIVDGFRQVFNGVRRIDNGADLRLNAADWQKRLDIALKKNTGFYTLHTSQSAVRKSSTPRRSLNQPSNPVLNTTQSAPVPPPPTPSVTRVKKSKTVSKPVWPILVTVVLFFIFYPRAVRSWRMASLCSTTEVSIEGNNVLVQDTARWTDVGMWLSVWVQINGEEHYAYAVRDRYLFEVGEPIQTVYLIGVRVVEGPLGGGPDQFCNNVFISPTLTPLHTTVSTISPSVIPLAVAEQKSANVQPEVTSANLSDPKIAVPTLPSANTQPVSDVTIGRVIANDWVNIRSGPGTNAAPLTSVRSGTNVVVLGKNEDSTWLLVQVEDVQGWMTAALVDLNGQSVPFIVPGSTPLTVQIPSTPVPTCGGVPTRFRPGETVIVDFNQDDALRILRDYRSGANQTLAQAYDNQSLRLNHGPDCYDRQWYWNVTLNLSSNSSFSGWAAETDESGHPYMCSLANRECR